MAHPSATSRCITPEAFSGDLTANTAAAEEQVGRTRVEYAAGFGYQKYMYVRNAVTAAIADGSACYWANDYYTDVTTAEVQNKKAGIGIGVISASQYGWIQIYGYHDAVLTDTGGDIADGDFLLYSTTNGTVNRGDANAKRVELAFGIAVENDDTTDVAANILLNVPY